MLKETLVTHWSQSAWWCLSFSLSMVSHFGNNTPQVHQIMKTCQNIVLLKWLTFQWRHPRILRRRSWLSLHRCPLARSWWSLWASWSWRSWWSRLSWSTLSQHTWHDHSRTTVDTNLILMRMWIHQKRIQICVSNKNHLQAGVLAASFIETMKCEPPGFTRCRLLIVDCRL